MALFCLKFKRKLGHKHLTFNVWRTVTGGTENISAPWRKRA